MNKSLREAYGEALLELGEKNEKVVVLDADLSHATQSCMFAKQFPDRFYNMGIAEANAVCAAAAFADFGYIPYFSTFAVFGAGRAFEQIRNSVAYVNANVKFVFTHAGITVGEDGGSHQAIEDIALMRSLPNMIVMVPCDPLETKKAVLAAAEIQGPVYVRVGRPSCEAITQEETPFVPGKAIELREGSDICLIACGLEVHEALKAAEQLKEDGIHAAVIDMHTIKPVDREVILKYQKNCRVIVTVEEHSVIGGLASAVSEVMAGRPGARFGSVGIRDRFGKSGKPEQLLEEFGLSAKRIAEYCKVILNQ